MGTEKKEHKEHMVEQASHVIVKRFFYDYAGGDQRKVARLLAKMLNDGVDIVEVMKDHLRRKNER